jgi:hypothetical protein
MVVLAVTWMAKVGHEAEVAALFEKLTEESRKEPGCHVPGAPAQDRGSAASSSTSSIKTMPRSKRIAPRHTSCSMPERPAKNCGPRGRAPVRAARVGLCGAGDLPASPLFFVDHQLAARSVTFLRNFLKSDGDGFAPSAGFFHQSVGDPFRDLALLLDGASLQHRDLNHRHITPVVSCR